MDEDATEKLAAQKSRLTEQLRSLQRQKRLLPRGKRKSPEEACTKLGKACSKAKLQVLYCVVVLSDGDVRNALQYYDHVSSSVAEESRGAVAAHLTAWWESLPPAARHAWLDDFSVTRQGKFALRAARKYLTESRLHSWVLRQNLAKGVAPCTKVVLQACLDEEAALLTPGFALPPAKRSRWQWMSRFREAWGVRMGRFQNLERLSPAEMRQKASCVFCVSAARASVALTAERKC